MIHIKHDLVDHKMQCVARNGADDDSTNASKQATNAFVLDDVSKSSPDTSIRY